MLQNKALTVEEICMKLKPVFGNKIDEVYLRYTMAESREEKEEIAHILSALYQKNLSVLLNKGVLLEPPIKEDVDGEYPLAVVSYAKKKLFPFALREQDWPRHVCISGMSGSGKTTLAFHIIDSLINRGKNFLIFDWKKSFRPLTLANKEIMLFTIGNDSVSNIFKMNINQPPRGVSPKEWINVLCDLLTESFFVSFGVHKILLETLDDAFKEWGVYNGSENYPTWNHIKWRLEQKLDSTRGREAGWVESALRIASVLTFGSFGSIVNYKGEGRMNVEDLLNSKVIFELNSLGNIEKKFFCEFILTYIYKFKKTNQDCSGGGKFNHAILVDEAHNIFLKEKTHFAKESVTDMIYREMREYGTSLICLDQHVSKLSDTVKGNSACHIAFQQQLPQDIYDISELMQLRERRYLFSQLPVGSAIVKLSERYTSPFLIEVGFVDLRTHLVSDKNVSDRMSCLFAGREIEKNPDNLFNRALVGEVELKEPIVESAFEENISYKGEEQTFFDKNQEEIYRIINERINIGERLSDIEKSLEKSGVFRTNDVIKVVNYIFSEQLSHLRKEEGLSVEADNVTTIEKQNLFKANLSNQSTGRKLTVEQERFLAFLQENPEHDFATVNVYKKVGLSPRKGNKIKNELLGMNLIEIKEIKYEKGWKKIIRLK